jgi:hypothetical protein
MSAMAWKFPACPQHAAAGLSAWDTAAPLAVVGFGMGRLARSAAKNKKLGGPESFGPA